MRIFSCDQCHQALYFDNTECLSCGHQLAWLPQARQLAALQAAGDNRWIAQSPALSGRQWRLCARRDLLGCNWALPAHTSDEGDLCASCRLTTMVPDLTVTTHVVALAALEKAKRRLLYGLLHLGLPLEGRTPERPDGLAFAFLAPQSGQVITTGHAGGLITVNLLEADPVERERQRQTFNEPSRTLLGHLRHESGHYFWERLVAGSAWLESFRALFGDERGDYQTASARHYAVGPPADWQTRCISAYASMHPWEDWAETWAHYLLVRDTLEMAAACGLQLQPPRDSLPAATEAGSVPHFDALLSDWGAVSHLLNALSRCMGLPDAWPLVINAPVRSKLSFVHRVIEATARTVGAQPAAS